MGFANRFALLAHSQVHKNHAKLPPKDVHCNICGKHYINQFALNGHMFIHPKIVRIQAGANSRKGGHSSTSIDEMTIDPDNLLTKLASKEKIKEELRKQLGIQRDAKETLGLSARDGLQYKVIATNVFDRASTFVTM